MALGHVTSIDTTARLVDRVPEPPIDFTRRTYTAEATFTVRDPDPGDLRDLAWAAVITPSSAAQEAFLVLVDALLERGLITTPPTEEEIETQRRVAFESGEPVAIHGDVRPRLVQAREWVTEATARPFMDRLGELFAKPFEPATYTAAHFRDLVRDAAAAHGYRRVGVTITSGHQHRGPGTVRAHIDTPIPDGVLAVMRQEIDHMIPVHVDLDITSEATDERFDYQLDAAGNLLPFPG